MSIGIVMILIGILMPMAGAAREQARQTRNLAAARGSLVLLNLYTDSNAGRYPVGWENSMYAAILWYLPLKRVGLIDSLEDVGIVDEAANRSLLTLTQTAILDQDVLGAAPWLIIALEAAAGAAALWSIIGGRWRPAAAAAGVVFVSLAVYSAALVIRPPASPAPCGCGLTGGVVEDWTPIAGRNAAAAAALLLAGTVLPGRTPEPDRTGA